jgi:hypothetical protein
VNDSTLFVVRVWRRREAFRASVRRVEDEEARWFDSAQEVARYLEDAAEGDAAARRPETNGGRR